MEQKRFSVEQIVAFLEASQSGSATRRVVFGVSKQMITSPFGLQSRREI